MGQGLKNDCNSQISCICICLQVMDKEATLEQDMEKEVCLNRNEVISYIHMLNWDVYQLMNDNE